jgi:hypothetical protein
MSLDTAQVLLNAIVKYNKLKDGSSGDAERDAGGELEAAAIDHLRSEAGRSIELAEMVDQVAHSLNEDVDDTSDLDD